MNKGPEHLVAEVVMQTANGLITTAASAFNQIAAELNKPTGPKPGKPVSPRP